MRLHRLAALAVAAVAAVPLALAVAAGPASAASSSDAVVSVFHGIPNVTVDVYVDNKLTLPGFKPGTMAGPLDLPAGTYSIKITAAGKPGDTLIGPASVTVAAGQNYTIAAYLTAAGKPTAGAFLNDTTTLAAGKARVTVRHLAEAPAVKITANGEVLVPSLANGQSASAVVPAATYSVAISPASGGAAVLTTPLPLPAGTNTVVYAWGDLSGGTFKLATQSITGLGAMPGSVPAGQVGLAHDETGVPGWAVAAVAAALVLAAASTWRLATTRQH